MDRVLRATAALLDESGAQTVTTTTVAARAEVSIGWLYNFFDDRQALLEEIRRHRIARPGPAVGRSGFQPGRPGMA